ncbi:MAG TPA: C25 family cysteine peptidase [Niastella sp.]
MRKIFTLLLLVAGFAATAQQYNNEWIQYSQTYFRIKVAKDGVYRIPKSQLDAMGIGGTNVQNFELWRNGEKVFFYPSVSSGVLPSNGYLEFWGEKNDGKPDKPLYRLPEYQHTTKLSLQTDTAIYFLSVSNNTNAGIRYTDVANNAGSSALPVEPYFMYTFGYYYVHPVNKSPNLGLAAIVGVPVYSSSYDQGEVFASEEIYPATNFTHTLYNFNVYPSGPQSTLKFGLVGAALNTRNIKVTVNGNEVKDTVMNYYNDLVTSAPVDNNTITGGSIAFRFRNMSTASTDRMVASFLELTYPSRWDFNGQSNFRFTLPAKSNGYLIHITNFNNNGVAPVLYDTKNGERYVGDISTGGIVKFALPGTATSRELALASMDAANVNIVNSYTTRVFTDYKLTANQGNYLIITNPILYTGSAGNNPIDDYKNYRQSAAGGSYKVLVTDINELTDQFAFGIKGHPLSVRNFVRYARLKFAEIKYVFLIGRGMNYADFQRTQRIPATYPFGDELNLVPTFGYPGSDNLLVADDIKVSVPAVPIGRLSVVRGSEIEDYLEKVKEYNITQTTAPNTVAGRGWMKNVVHVTGSSDAYLGTVLCNYMEQYQQIIEDTVFGADVHTFCKTSTNPVEQVSPDKIAQLFNEGITFLTYFGHSSATTLEFNLDDPMNYNNQGKYPVFFVNGCKAGDFFTYYKERLLFNETLSEKFILAKQRGTIGFVASTHFGIVNYLNVYLTGLYENLTRQDYNKSLGETIKSALQTLLNATGTYDFYSRMHAEQITLHGDPAIYINSQPKADYVIEESLIKISPPFISLVEKNFTVKVKAVNLGKAVRDSIVLEIKQQYPNGTTGTLYRQKIKGIRDADSVELTVPVVASRDKGQNKLIVTIDADGIVNEVSENNNTATKDFYIYEDEARPVYPYTYAITNNPNEKLYASTANPVTSTKTWLMEIDTSGKFNSPVKVSKSVVSGGGIIEFNHGLNFVDNTVYYWRVAPQVPNADLRWNVSSFTYRNGVENGFIQSQYDQHKESELVRISLDSTDHLYKYGTRENFFIIRNGIFPTAAGNAQDFSVTVNNDDKIQSVCGVSGIIFYVFDSVTMKPWFNAEANQPGRLGSDVVCGTNRRWQFQFNMVPGDTAVRHRIINFMDNIPAGSYVVVNNIWSYVPGNNVYPNEWIGDTAYWGSNTSVYHRLLEQGFVKIDSINKPRAFSFMYRKDRQGFFGPRFVISDSTYDRITLSTSVISPDTVGYINSPKFGPAKSWKKVEWDGVSLESPTVDNPTVDVVGSDYSGMETVLFKLDRNTRTMDISSVDSSKYPFIQLKMRNVDSVNVSPFQLKKWGVYYEPVPEGSLAANIYFTAKDTVGLGEQVPIGIAFKNISKLPFDSMLVKVNLIDKSNITHSMLSTKMKPIAVGDTIMVNVLVDTKNFGGNNVVQVDVNPDNDQPEYYHFNNVLYHNLYVIPDNTKPLLDVTFDGVHILNNDLVSAKPHIQIKIKDESKNMLLSDTSISTVQVRYPDGTLRTYHFDGDTLKFIPATSTTDNVATIEFTPQFTSQIDPNGDEYELVVVGKDASGNKASDIAYRIGFKVISKPMISNLLNYPNPFSTSTAFVFTVTGSDIPQNIRIQILTVTGKIVREITMNELGPLHIGRNITEFKWDGTDQYGQKLGNGVYLYRVITSLNGKPMDKYKATGDDTDKYFNNGYGKMYLMR